MTLTDRVGQTTLAKHVRHTSINSGVNFGSQDIYFCHCALAHALRKLVYGGLVAPLIGLSLPTRRVFKSGLHSR